MSYFNSNSIHVYPLSTTRAPGVDNGARDTYLSEYAITNLVKAIVDKDKYVYYANNDWSSPTKLMFVIDGYMFDLDLTSTLNTGNLFVKLNKSASSNLFPEISSDTSDGFTGLEYITDITSITNEQDKAKYFQLLENGKVPESSKIKFEIGKSIDFFQDYNIIVDGNGVTNTSQE